MEYDPEKKVKLKCVDGSPVENHGVVEAKIVLSNGQIMNDFQLVNKQVDILCDGILGCDFLQCAKAKFCYETWTVSLSRQTCK
jgi:hypothetical protein